MFENYCWVIFLFYAECCGKLDFPGSSNPQGCKYYKNEIKTKFKPPSGDKILSYLRHFIFSKLFFYSHPIPLVLRKVRLFPAKFNTEPFFCKMTDKLFCIKKTGSVKVRLPFSLKRFKPISERNK